MFAGILGTADLAATVYGSVYRNLKDKTSAVTINVCNRSGATGRIDIAISTSSSTPTDSEFIVRQAVLNPNDVIEKLGILVPSGEYVLIRSNIPNVSAVIYGVQTGEDL
jgi:hypothetical protein